MASSIGSTPYTLQPDGRRERGVVEHEHRDRLGRNRQQRDREHHQKRAGSTACHGNKRQHASDESVVVDLRQRRQLHHLAEHQQHDVCGKQEKLPRAAAGRWSPRGQAAASPLAAGRSAGGFAPARWQAPLPITVPKLVSIQFHQFITPSSVANGLVANHSRFQACPACRHCPRGKPRAPPSTPHSVSQQASRSPRTSPTQAQLPSSASSMPPHTSGRGFRLALSGSHRQSAEK